MSGIYKRSEDHKKLMSLKLKNRKFKPETLEKMKKAKLGKKQSVEHVKNNVNARMNNGKFKENAKYNAIHEWIRRRKSKTELCEMCNKEKPYDLANLSGEYKRNVDDFKWLCRKCHYHLDRRIFFNG